MKKDEKASFAVNGHPDPEQHSMADAHLDNTLVETFTWSGVSVTVRDRQTKNAKAIVDDASGIVHAGE